MNGGGGRNYYRHRIYHPQLGRFCSRDPVGYGDGSNLLQYASGLPGNTADPTGLRIVVFHDDCWWRNSFDDCSAGHCTFLGVTYGCEWFSTPGLFHRGIRGECMCATADDLDTVVMGTMAAFFLLFGLTDGPQPGFADAPAGAVILLMAPPSSRDNSPSCQPPTAQPRPVPVESWNETAIRVCSAHCRTHPDVQTHGPPCYEKCMNICLQGFPEYLRPSHTDTLCPCD